MFECLSKHHQTQHEMRYCISVKMGWNIRQCILFILTYIACNILHYQHSV